MRLDRGLFPLLLPAAAPLAQQQPKIFGIGLSKTGTTTLAACFHMLGLTNRASYSSELMASVIENDLDRIFSYADTFDVFEDVPWFGLYAPLAQHYSDALFILTKRKDGKTWVQSALNHDINTSLEVKEIGQRFFGAVFPGLAFDDIHDTHNARVRAFFADQPHRLLELCWEEDASWEALCAFLGKPVPDFPFPHENKGAY